MVILFRIWCFSYLYENGKCLVFMKKQSPGFSYLENSVLGLLLLFKNCIYQVGLVKKSGYEEKGSA